MLNKICRNVSWLIFYWRHQTKFQYLCVIEVVRQRCLIQCAARIMEAANMLAITAVIILMLFG